MRHVMNSVTALAISLVLASTALADEVVLRNGSSFTGLVREEGDKVTVEVDFGTMTFRKVDVKSISRGNDPVNEYETKLKAATDVKSLLELATWAREKGLGTKSMDLYRKVLTLDTDQPDARKALGFEKFNGIWMSGDDLMMARGYVKVNGKWQTKETADLLLIQQEQAHLENDRNLLQKRLADQVHEQEMTKIALERERLEMERRDDRWWWRNGWNYAAGPFGGVAGYLVPNSVRATTVPYYNPSSLPPAGTNSSTPPIIRR